MLSRYAAELGTACATLALGLVILVGATEFGIGWDVSGPQPGAFPFYMGVLVAASSLGIILQTLLTGAGRRVVALDRAQAIRVATFFAPMVAFVVGAILLGLYVATALYLFLVMRLQGGYPAWRAAVTGLGVAGFFYLVLEVWFQVPLMKGPLEAALGIY
jgi:hypothetical protein